MSDSDTWPPSASLELLRARARLNALLRDFFAARGVLEVEVPLLARRGVSDPHIACIEARAAGQQRFLQSSPEYFMKRLLAAGSGDIYCLGRAFRDGEEGARHNPEFTMLEWYRRGWDEHRLMDEVEALLRACLPLTSVRRVSYRQLFEQHLQIDPHRADIAQLQALARERVGVDWSDTDPDMWLDLLMTHVIEPRLGPGLVFVCDYPASQAALARVEADGSGQLVARRFEAYLDGVELANGYWELCDADEQWRRFESDNRRRQALGRPPVEADQQLLDALRSGLPACAGVALGVDRLLLRQQGLTDIRQVLAFPWSRS